MFLYIYIYFLKIILKKKKNPFKLGRSTFARKSEATKLRVEAPIDRERLRWQDTK